MTSSTDAPIAPLPPALHSMWRLCKLGYRHEPRLIVVSFTLALVAALPDALVAWWFKLIGEGALAFCRENGVAVEINSRPERLDPPMRLLKLAAEIGCEFAIDSEVGRGTTVTVVKWTR